MHVCLTLCIEFYNKLLLFDHFNHSDTSIHSTSIIYLHVALLFFLVDLQREDKKKEKKPADKRSATKAAGLKTL